MKRNDRKFTNKNHDREFETMKNNLKKDGIGVPGRHNYSSQQGQQGRRPYHKPYENNRPYTSNRDEIGTTVAESPVEKVTDFVKLMSEIVSDVDPAASFILLTVDKQITDMSGRVTAVVKCRKDEQSEYNDGVTFFYIEDYSVNRRPQVRLKAYPASLICISNSSQKILFSKVNPNTVEYSDRYIKSIIEKELSYVITVNNEDAVEIGDRDVDMVDVDVDAE